MKITLRVREWSDGRQMGFQLGADTIRTLSEELNLPDKRNRYSSLREFIALVESGGRPDAYSRVVSVGMTDGTGIRVFGDVNHSISHTRTSIQNHIEVGPDQEELRTWVREHIGEELPGEYLVGPKKDVLLLLTEPDNERAVVTEFAERLTPRARRKLRREDPRAQLGRYFEEVAVAWCQERWPGWDVSWRYPFLDSKHEYLRSKGIICDIDLTQGKRYRCVEVKSVKGLPMLPFILTASEWRSRELARSLPNVEYSILVFYYATPESYAPPVLFEKTVEFEKRTPTAWMVTPRV